MGTAPPSDSIESNNVLVRFRLRGTAPILFNGFTQRAMRSLEVKGKKGAILTPEQAGEECREKLHYDPSVELPDGIEFAFELDGKPNRPDIGIPFAWLWGALKGGTKGKTVGTTKSNYTKADGSTVLGAHVSLLGTFWAFDPAHQKWTVDKTIGNNKNAGGGKGAAMPVYRAKVSTGWEVVIYANISTLSNNEETFRGFFGNAGGAIGMGSARVGNGGAFGSFVVSSWRSVHLPDDMIDFEALSTLATQVMWNEVPEQVIQRTFTARDLPGIPLRDGADLSNSTDHSAMSQVTLPTTLDAVKEAIKADYATDNNGKPLKSVFQVRIDAALDERFGTGQWEIDGKTVREPVTASDEASLGMIPPNGSGGVDNTIGGSPTA
jgi:hypothetical protein